MALWSDLAQWRGPSPHTAGKMQEVRGLVIHIAAGFFGGTIAWQMGDESGISSHFVVGRDGRCAQVVDTAIAAVTQGKGNGHWLSSENEGFLKGDKRGGPDWYKLSPEMIETNAQLLARAHHEYGVPLQLATHPDHRGLGYHSMGAENGIKWGHSACPGEPIKAQLPEILARAIEIVNGGNDMADPILICGTPDNYQGEDPTKVFYAYHGRRYHVLNEQDLEDIRYAARKLGEAPLRNGGEVMAVMNLNAFGREAVLELTTAQLDYIVDRLAKRMPTVDQIADAFAVKYATASRAAADAIDGN